MQYLEAEQIHIKFTGTRCNVPNNPWARLMYYLNCVESVINGIDFHYLSNYNEYTKMDADDKITILEIIQKCDPKTLNQIGLFHIIADDNSYDANEFIEITDQRLVGIHIPDCISFAGYSGRVRKIMIAKVSWYYNNYFKPLETIEAMLQSPPPTAIVYAQPSHVSNPYPSKSHSSSSKDCKDIFCCDSYKCNWYKCTCWCDCDGCTCCTCFLALLCIACPALCILCMLIGCCASEQTIRCVSFYSSVIGMIMYIIIFTA